MTAHSLNMLNSPLQALKSSIQPKHCQSFRLRHCTAKARLFSCAFSQAMAVAMAYVTINCDRVKGSGSILNLRWTLRKDTFLFCFVPFSAISACCTHSTFILLLATSQSAEIAFVTFSVSSYVKRFIRFWRHIL